MRNKGMLVLLLALTLALPMAVRAEEAPMERIFDIFTRNHQDPQTFEEYDRLATIAYAKGEYAEAAIVLDEEAEITEAAESILWLV